MGNKGRGCLIRHLKSHKVPSPFPLTFSNPLPEWNPGCLLYICWRSFLLSLESGTRLYRLLTVGYCAVWRGNLCLYVNMDGSMAYHSSVVSWTVFSYLGPEEPHMFSGGSKNSL